MSVKSLSQKRTLAKLLIIAQWKKKSRNQFEIRQQFFTYKKEKNILNVF